MSVNRSTSRPGMRLRMPGRFVPAGLLICMVLTAAPADAQQRSAPRRGGTVVIAGGNDLHNMNSMVNSESWTSEFINHALFLRLVTFTSNLGYAPQLAQSWRMIGDTAVVFRMRRDVRWHDGVRTSAHDVAFTFDRIKNKETASPAFEQFTKWKGAQVVDSFTIRFSLESHVEPLYPWAQTAIMPRHLLDSVPPARMRQATFNKKPVGNGPFRFVSYQPNERWVFEANQSFPRALGGRPLLDRVVWRVIPENTAQVAEIRTGQVDMAVGVRAENMDALHREPGMRGMFRHNNRYLMLTWNGSKAPLDDARVRRAITMSLNRPQMLRLLRRGYGTIASSPVAPGHWAYDKSLPPLPFDTAAARRLLASAGWRDRDRDGVLENAAGQKLEIELKIAANNQSNRDMGESVRSQLERVGIKINVRPTDFATLIQDITKHPRNFEGAYLQFGTDLRLSFRDAFHSTSLEGAYQAHQYSNPEVDRIIDRAAVTHDRKAATALWKRFQRIMRQDQPDTFLWWSPDLFVVRSRLQGVQMDVRGALLTLPRWYVTRN